MFVAPCTEAAMNARKHQNDHTSAADAALEKATDSFGSAEFPLLMVEYQRAMEHLCSYRAALRRNPAPASAAPLKGPRPDAVRGEQQRA